MRNPQSFFYRTSIYCLSLIIVGSLLAINTKSSATSALAAGFDANYLTSDAVFTARDSMNVGDIQAFLQAKGSVLANISSDQLGEGSGGRSAAQIIYDAARTNRTDFARGSGYGPENPLVMNLNPQVILITLQKEQSLITANYVSGSPSTTSALRSAMGYGCPDSGGCSSTYAGFTNQVVYAAAQFMRNYYKASSSSYKPGQTYAITNTTGPPYNAPASQSVYIGNAASSSLYQYTPHVYNGNYNFWYFMNQWFIQVFNPTLVRATGEAAVYIVDNGARFPIDSLETFAALNLSWANVQTMTSAQQALPIGPLVRRLLLGNDGGTVYLLNNGQKRKITSIRIFQMSGFRWDDVSVPSNLSPSIPEGLPIYTLARGYGTAGVYMMTWGRGYNFPSAEMFQNVWGYRWDEIGDVPAQAFASSPTNFWVTRVTKGSGPAVYLMDGGNKLAFPSLDTFTHFGFRWDQITQLDDGLLNEKPEGNSLSRLIKGNSPAVYFIENGTKRPIDSIAAFNRARFNWADVRIISDNFLNTLPNGPVIK